MTVLDELPEEYIQNKNLLEFLKYLSMDQNNESFCDQPDNFELYINISKYAKNSLPKTILEHEIFNEYRIIKKHFPRK